MQKPSTKIKRKVSKTTGIPTSSSGRKRKAQKSATGGGCIIPVIVIITMLIAALSVGCSRAEIKSTNPYFEQAQNAFQHVCKMDESKAKEAAQILDKCDILKAEIELSKVGDEYVMQIDYEPYRLTVEDGELVKVCTYRDRIVLYENGDYHKLEATTAKKEEPQATTSPTTEKTTEAATQPTTEAKTDPPVEEDNYNLVVTNWTNTVEAGSDASLTIQGKPNTQYSIAVFYHSGASDAEGLEPKTSDENGIVTWNWKVGARTAKDTYDITVSGDGKHETVQFKVI